ncbi:MAG: hypothetical protein RMJ43_02845 [Chloroherpetonaceae bacterium]|nr:hypothetical protein [Chthonomonadaceae bacterium]MDW8206746.1 hypothetical protein [Chloroherpetonaceae bacterium]
MRDRPVTWWHVVLAGVALMFTLFLLWRWAGQQAGTMPTAPAPRGANPSHVAPDSP